MNQITYPYTDSDGNPISYLEEMRHYQICTSLSTSSQISPESPKEVSA